MAIKQTLVKPERNGNGYGFAILMIGYQVMVCLFYAYWFAYQPVTTASTWDEGELFLVGSLAVLVLIGFGVINGYITNASFSGMGMTLLIFGLTLEHFFLIKAFWEKAGTSDPNNSKSWSPTPFISKISFVNWAQDRYDNLAGTSLAHDTQFYTHHSFVDAIACALANTVAFGSVVGRIKLFQVFWLTAFGTFIYEVNAQLLWRYSISDVGFGMRIFIYGGFVGLISGLILGRKETTVNHPRYMSVYASRAFGLLGLCVAFCTFPSLVAGSLYKSSTNNTYILYSSVLRMYLALVAGVLGSFSCSALTYRKIFAHDVIFSAITGGIVYSSSSNLHQNPAVPLASGFLMAFVSTWRHSQAIRRFNKTGVNSSIAYLDRFVFPGIFCGILSAILYAINQGSDGGYTLYRPSDRSNIGQGGMQLAGIGLSIAIGIVGGLLVGLMYKILNRNRFQDQFNDGQIYRPDFPPSYHIIDWKET